MSPAPPQPELGADPRRRSAPELRPGIVAIDGPAASGKSTAARALAARLGYAFLDTGAMYRAVTREVIARGIDPTDARRAAEVAERLALDLDPAGRLIVDGVPAGPELRARAVDDSVSDVALHSGVRRALVARQQAIGRASRDEGRGVVAEGRDTTTVVFPDADHKFFLIASAGERARRRALEEGAPARAPEVQREIERRDEIDSTRADSPLRQAFDSTVVVTDGLTPEDVVDAMVEVIAGAIDRAKSAPGAAADLGATRFRPLAGGNSI